MKRAIPAFFFAFVAFVLFILVTVSAPFIKTLYLSHIQSTHDGSLGLNLGVFGSCYPGRATVLGITVSHQACSSPHYPYTLDPAFFGYNTTLSANYNPLSSKFMQNGMLSLVQDVGKALILNPIAAALALLSFIPSLISICTTWRFTQIMAWIFLLLATVCSWIAFIVNCVFAAVVRNRVKDQTNGNYAAKFGNAVWISLAGAILMTIAMVMALFGSCCCVKRNKVADEDLAAHHAAGHDVEADAAHAHRGNSADELRTSAEKEKVHGDLATPVDTAPKKKFALPWGKKAHVAEQPVEPVAAHTTH